MLIRILLSGVVLGASLYFAACEVGLAAKSNHAQDAAHALLGVGIAVLGLSGAGLVLTLIWGTP